MIDIDGEYLSFVVFWAGYSGCVPDDTEFALQIDGIQNHSRTQ